MQKVIFITGNQKKADYMANYLGYPVKHVKLDLDEIQSMDLIEIVEHKIRQAYAKIKKPVIVEDVALECELLGGLPGPFVRFFLENMPMEVFCSLFNDKNRRTTAHSAFGYFDGKELKIFEAKLAGQIAEKPAGNGGFGWDRIFIPKGYSVTRASLSEDDDRQTYLQFKPFEKLKEFLESKHEFLN